MYFYDYFISIYYYVCRDITPHALKVFYMTSYSPIGSTSIFGQGRQRVISFTDVGGSFTYNILVNFDKHRSLIENIVISIALLGKGVT